VAAEKNLKRGVAAAGRRKSGDGGSESGFGDLRFGSESPWRRGGGGSRGRGGGGGSRGRGGGDGAGATGGRIRARWCMGQQIWASWTDRIRPMSCFFIFSFLFYPFSLVLLNYIPIFFYFYILIRRRLALRLTA
jgi:hypothetical protein